jgi:hypothetical protein
LGRGGAPSGGLAAALAVGHVGGDEAVEVGLALDVALDEVNAAVVAGGDVGDGDGAVDALAVQDALARGQAVAGQLDTLAGDAHRRCSPPAQRAWPP